MHEVLVSKIFNYTSTPTKNVEGQFWFNPSTNILSRFNGTIWKPITVSSDDVAVLTDGNKVSLTNYLNTQIAALAEGIDSKQDSLHTYTETESTGEHGSKSWSTIKIHAEGGENTSGSIKLQADTGGAVSDDSSITLNCIGGHGRITLGSEFDNNDIVINGNITGTAISTSIPASAANTSDGKVPTTKAVKTELDKKQDKLSNPGFLYLNNGHAISECKPTFSSTQSLVFTYEVAEEELNDAPWSILGNIRIWDSKKGLGIAKQSKTGGNGLQCGFNWGYGQNGDTTSRAFLEVKKAQFADGKPHTWALVCGKNATNGFLKLYRDGVLIDSKTSLALFDDFTPEYGFSLGKHQTPASNDNPAKGRISNVAFFNFDISDSTKTYTINDYHNGKSIPQSLISATEGDKAIWVLDNYTRTNSSSKKYIKDLAGNNDAIITNDIHDIIDGKVDDILDSNNTLYQTKEDNSLLTTDKTITGSINELKTSVDSKQNKLSFYTENTTKQRSEFSKTVKANNFQVGEQISADSGVSYWNISKLDFNTPAGNATYAYNGIDISNAFFKVVGSGSNPYVQIPDNNGSNFKIWKGTETQFKTLTSVNSDTVYLRVQENNRIKATVGTDTASLENITDSYTLSSASFTSFITDTKYNNAQGSILITPSLTNSGALIFGEGITDISKGFPLYPDNIVSIPFKNITNFKVAGNLNDSFNYIISFDI